jgi:hypothetical protein
MPLINNDATEQALDASGGSVFRIITGPVMLELKSRRRVNFAVMRLFCD